MCAGTTLLITALLAPGGHVQVSRVTTPAARFTKYLTTILRLSYDNAKVTTDLRRMSTIYETSYEGRKAFLRYDSLAKL